MFAGNDQMALGVLRALHELGRRVPDDVSVVGFDDIPEAAFFTPPLTTVRQRFDEVGRRAVIALLEQIDGAARTGARTTIAPELVVRASTAAPSAVAEARRPRASGSRSPRSRSRRPRA